VPRFYHDTLALPTPRGLLYVRSYAPAPSVLCTSCVVTEVSPTYIPLALPPVLMLHSRLAPQANIHIALYTSCVLIESVALTPRIFPRLLPHSLPFPLFHLHFLLQSTHNLI